MVAEADVMGDHVNVDIPFGPDIARALESRVRREAAGRVLGGPLKGGHLRDVPGDVTGAAKREARANGQMDADIDADPDAWRDGSRYQGDARKRSPQGGGPGDIV